MTPIHPRTPPLARGLEIGSSARVNLQDALAENQTLRGELAAQQAQINQLTRLVDGLQDQLQQALIALATLQAGKSGTKRGHRGVDDPPQPDEDDPEPALDPVALRKAAREGRKARRRKRKKAKWPKKTPKRKSLPAQLERIEKREPLSACKDCGSDDLYELPPEVSERLHYIPAKVVVRVLVREKGRCKVCEGFSTAPMPPTAIPYGQMTSDFLAHLIHSKCGLHLPMNRVLEDLQRQGISVASSTACDAFKHAADLLGPIYDRLVDALFASKLVCADGTGVDVLRPDENGKYRGQIAVWCNTDWTIYQFSEDKSGVHFRDFLRLDASDSDRRPAYQGRLVVDMGSNMNAAFWDSGIVKCGCWQHAREKFVAARARSPIAAEHGLAWIGTLFDVEHAADDAGDTAEERLARRKREMPSLLAGLTKWMAESLPTVAPEEELAVAIRYVQRHWRALTQMLTDGSVPLTNNLAERELGVIGRGRKNWLFFGSDLGGRRLAVLCTVVRSCQRLGIDPFAYLAWVLPRLSDLPVNRGVNVLPDLMPLAFKKAREQAPTG